MTYNDAEGVIQTLRIREALAIKQARFLEQQALKFKQQAVKLREHANNLAGQQAQVWKEVDDSEF